MLLYNKTPVDRTVVAAEWVYSRLDALVDPTHGVHGLRTNM